MMNTLKLLALTLLAAGLLFAQAVARGTVTGRVLNSAGTALADVPVVVRVDVAPNFKATGATNSTGQFSISEVPPGKVMVSAVNANGVDRASVTGTLTGGTPLNLTIRIPSGK